MSGGRRSGGLLAVIGPGLLVAATGVGAGDLFTAGFAGQKFGVAVLWAVVVGGALKLVLTEGLARWQLATGETLLEGCVRRLGWAFTIPFGFYLVAWSYFVGAALVSACGVTLTAIANRVAPATLSVDPASGKLVFGVLASALGVVVALAGGFRLFERVMTACVGVMFATVVCTACLLQPSWSEALVGLVVPTIPQLGSGGLQWTLALMGGVGGTLTVIVYGYWMREVGRDGVDDLGTMRLDLACGYAVTVLFGLAMVVIGSRVAGSGRGAGFIVTVADHLEGPLGSAGSVVFLAGASAAVVSSLLGVWQSVPYVFADLVGLVGDKTSEERRLLVSPSSSTYRGYLAALAVVPLIALRFPFREVQKIYGVVGACFMPFLAAVLLYLLGRPRWTGAALSNGWIGNVLLVIALVMFLVFGYLGLT